MTFSLLVARKIAKFSHTVIKKNNQNLSAMISEWKSLMNKNLLNRFRYASSFSVYKGLFVHMICVCVYIFTLFVLAWDEKKWSLISLLFIPAVFLHILHSLIFSFIFHLPASYQSVPYLFSCSSFFSHVLNPFQYLDQHHRPSLLSLGWICVWGPRNQVLAGFFCSVKLKLS